jgi:uncharacterized membrane protein YoaK (UPF0700 family)
MPSRPQYFRIFLVGGVLLAVVAGFINAVTILSPGQVTATHVTGTVTRAAVAFADPKSGLDFRIAGLLVLSFIAGSAITGAALDSTKLRFGRRYGGLLMLESGLLVISAMSFEDHLVQGLLLAALASGIQNALATQYSQAIVRTTHVTGIVTDLGIALGKWMSRRGVDWWRVQIYCGILTGFVSGGMMGALAWETLGARALMIPAAVLALMGVVYWTVRDRLVAIS